MESRTLANFDLDELEHKVNALIELNQRLRDENSTLRTHQDALVAERDDLLDKTTLTRTRIEAMLARLRALETQL
jgi:cell division protein ZapB